METTTAPFLAFIDDDTVFQFTAKILLKKKFHIDNVLLFNNGQEAFDYFETHKDQKNKMPSVIFVDINMPLMNGWEFIEKITPYSNNELENVDVYMISSSIDNRDVEKSKEFKLIKEFVSKPLTINVFENLLSKRFQQYNAYLNSGISKAV